MNVLIACEESQRVCIAFRKLGFKAFSCDILPCSGGHPEWHIQGDVLKVIKNTDCGYGPKEGINFETQDGTFHILDKEGWDLMIAHPPCTRIANSGVRWLHERDLWDEMKQACLFFKKLLESDCKHKVIENPIPHKYALEIIGKKYNQIIQPWQFGHGETKATCLWIVGLPDLNATNIVEGREQRIWKLPPSANRAKLRSKTYLGIAEALATQWGDFIISGMTVEEWENARK